jgi:transcription elongation factor Elf1
MATKPKAKRKIKEQNLTWTCPSCNRTLSVDYEDSSWQIVEMVKRDFNEATLEHLAECKG